MNDRDLLIEQILQEVAQREAAPVTPASYGNQDTLVDEILAQSAYTPAKTESRQEEPTVPPEEEPVAKEQPPAKPEKKKRSKKEDTMGFLAHITPWEERHKEASIQGAMNEGTPVEKAVGIKKTESFYSVLKQESRREEKDAGQLLYKNAGSLHPAVEEPAPVPVGEMQEVSADTLQEQVEEATRQLDAVDEPTRVLPEKRKEAALAAEGKTVALGAGVLAKADELTGQIRMAGFETAETEIEDDTWQEEFLSSRQDKIRQFKMDELDSDEGIPATSFEEDGEYHSVRDAAALKYDLLARRRNITVQLLTTLILFVLSLAFTVVDTMDITSGLLSDNPGVLLGLYLTVLAVGFLVNGRMLLGGLGSLFSGGDQDSPAALAMVTALFQGVGFAILSGSGGGSRPASFLGCAALFTVFTNLWGKRVLFSRMYSNLELIANDRVKHAVATVNNREEAFELGRGLAVGAPGVAFSYQGVDLQQFVYHSYAPDGVERAARWPVMLSPVFGLLGGVAAYFFAGHTDTIEMILQVLTGVCGGLIMSLPITLLLAGNLSFQRFGKKLRRHRVMLSGYDGVEEFCDTDVLALDASQLFPSGSITLKSIKSASNQSLDRSIMDVAGVVYMADCPLKSLFENMIQGKTNLLPQVDTLVYEEEMGISGWVMGYRVLVGTKKLMENHGILVPDVDYEDKYNQPGLKAVYLSTQGILSAVFLVKYSADEKVKAGLQKAVNAGLSLHIYSCDPNITREMICKMFKLPTSAVRIMGAVPRRLYKQQIQSAEEPQAVLSYEGNAGGFCRGVVAAMKLFRVIRLSAVLQTLCAILGGVLLAAGLVLLAEAALSGLLVLAYQLITTLLILAIPALMGR